MLCGTGTDNWNRQLEHIIPPQGNYPLSPNCLVTSLPHPNVASARDLLVKDSYGNSDLESHLALSDQG